MADDRPASRPSRPTGEDSAPARIVMEENRRASVRQTSDVNERRAVELRQGDLFVTGPHGNWVWDAQGHHLATIVMPEQPTNLAWGDKDYNTLYITATTSVYCLRTKIRGFVPYSVHRRRHH